MNSPLDLRSLSDSHQLARHLAAAAHGKAGSCRISVGVLVGEQRFFASMEDHGTVASHGDDPIMLGCLMKAFTATLVADVVKRNSQWAGQDAASLLALNGPCAASLRQIRLRHLLNHTHGLDASSLESLPQRTDGSVEARVLGEVLSSTTSLFAPGELYSYGNAGAWLSAAILERLSQRKYHELLLERLVQPLALSSVQNLTEHACPATGNGVSMSINDVLTFLNFHLGGCGPGSGHPPDLFAALTSMRSEPFPLPGWTPSERAACEGWKSYGSGWYGHNAATYGYLGMVRFNPDTQTAIVFASERMSSFATFVRLFAPVLPECRNVRPPRALSADAVKTLDVDRYTGTYCTAALALGLTRRDTALVCALTSQLEPPDAGSLEPASLRPASDDVFFPKGEYRPEIPFLQFIVPRTDGYAYVWNGRCVWRRCNAADLGRQLSRSSPAH